MLTNVTTPNYAAPVAKPVTLTAGAEDTSYTITAATLLAGVTDVDSSSLSITAVSVASGGGTIVSNGNGTWTYKPAANYNGPVSFNYTASDGSLKASSTASLTLAAVNDAPVTKPVTLIGGTEDTSYTITAATLLAGVTDVDSSSVSIAAVSVASGGGSIVDNGNGTWSYTPAANYNGPVKFNYTASDGSLSSSSTASLTLKAVNDAPVAKPVTLTAGIEDTGYTITAATLMGGVTDVDNSLSLSITAVSVASGGGSIVNNGNGTWTYKPAANYNGPVSFNYTASDGLLKASSTASLTLAAVNDAPVAKPVTLTAGTEDTSYTITAATLLAGVTDVDSSSVSITAVSVTSGGGSIVDNGNGTWSYTPAANYNGPVKFSYTASDGSLSSSSTASVTLKAVNDGPVATPVTLTAGTEDTSYTITAATLLGGVTDVDNTWLSITAVSVASGGGSIVNNGNGTWTYKPAANYNGPVSFNYTASDGLLKASSTASLTLAAVNDAPVSKPVTLTAGTEDTSYTITAATLLAGVTDVDSSSLSITAVSVASGGGSIVDNGNGTWSYTPAANYNGPVKFNYTASDGSLSSSSTASLTLKAVNDGPVATPVTLTAGAENTSYTITAAILLGGVTDVDNTWLSITAVSVASGGGSIVSNGNGTWTYKPAANYNGPVSFNYTASDGALKASSTASLTLAAANDAPESKPVTLTAGTEDTSYTITAATLLAGVTDVDSSLVSITAVSVASGGGSIVDNGNGTWSYTPAANQNGPVSFNYTASDGSLSSSSTAILTLGAVNDAPTTAPLTLTAGTEDTGYIITAATLLGGATDVDSSSLSITAVSVASGGGSIVDNGNGTWSYTPAANYNGPVSFNYTASDGLLSSSSTASLTLAAVNDAPVATPVMLVDGTEGAAYTLDAATMLAGVTDVDSSSLSITAVSVASGGGSIVDNGNGTWNYTPTANYSGPVSFSYTASDGSLSASSTASLTLTAVGNATAAQAADLLSGSDILFGGTANDLLSGGGGGDLFVVSKGYGSDTVSDFQAGAGGDVLRVQNYGFSTFATFLAVAKQVGSDTVVNLSSTEKLTLQNVALSSLVTANVVLDNPLPASGAANTTLTAVQADSALVSGSANDYLQATGTGVTLAGGGGDDRYVVYDHNTKVVEQSGQGIDTIFAARYDGYSLVNAPSVENLTLTGSTSGPATGNDLSNILTGNAGNNRLDGGLGNDVLTGGAGKDTFVIAAGSGTDTIIDFATGAGGDILQLSGTNFKTFADVQAAMTQIGTDVILKLGNNETVTLENTSVQAFTASNVNISMPASGLVQTFNDDFNYISAGQDPTLTWRTSYAWSGAASYLLAGEQGIYVDSSFLGLPGTQAATTLGIDPFSLKDGQLVITARPIDSDDFAYVGGAQFSTGMITSENSFVQTYGYFEMTATLPDTTGAWPAFWLLPLNGHYSTELDVLEGFGQNPDSAHWQIHSSTGSAAGAGSWANTGNLTAGQHTFAVEWTPYELTFFVDGTEIGRAPTPSDMNTSMYMIANLAMGGWAGTAAAGSTATMSIDAIKAYQLSEYTLANYSLRVSDAATNTLVGTSGADTLIGTSGNDLIDGAGGADTMTGGMGDDTYIVMDLNAKVSESVGGGVDTVKSSATYALSDYVENLTLTDSAAINATGNWQANIITGNDAANVITGGLGNDVLTGGNGSDTFAISKGDGSDIITDLDAGSGAGHDVVSLSGFAFASFADIQFGMTQQGADVYLKLTTNDTLVFRDTNVADFVSDDFQLPGALPTSGTPTSWWNATGPSQFVYGTAMNDNLKTGGIGDTLVGWSGDDTYVVGSANTSIVERPGDGVDTVQAWVSYALADNVENLSLMQGLAGTGNALANRMVGSSGNDVLDGAGGNDWLFGGAGNDTFKYSIGGGHDTIADFHVFTNSTAERDKLVLSGYDASAYLTHVDDEWTVHHAGGTDTFRIVGVTQLSSSDFAFVI
ncbi:cadherin-like domain-containing protein [Bradyrhizobium sp. JYMT SZCCT0428]|uniref:cadherin-like domain-containing protein n=1 Tax=Bradyrhizobium sp. JYMT SZCCT0428 TaxID=2807673 RepID=UPI001BAD3315|nr:cadherin-like domain-containing protein [Bradyrhizobium sp. JYMT SZCCT0428]MBR1151560.1 cadherin-like domain-containing protein [Bradyrhizobium sp. JYMT SZCCT0428]